MQLCPRKTIAMTAGKPVCHRAIRAAASPFSPFFASPESHIVPFRYPAKILSGAQMHTA